MNAVGLHLDMVTMVHEGGHAIHSFVTHNLEIVDFKSTPSEVAELASMSMELISMEHWEVFFENKDDLKRAKKEQLEKSLKTLLWIAVIDKFQHWVYLHPEHSVVERSARWNSLITEFSSTVAVSFFLLLLWIAVIDKFQHRVYLHPEHSVVERSARWNSLITEFSSTV